MKKIETSELEALQNLNKSFTDLRTKLADLEIANRNIQSQKNAVFLDMDGLSTKFKSLEADLLEKYGNVKVNLETGEITDDKN
jgi:predicted  nucleic acid-binding Zn-ribbon protein